MSSRPYPHRIARALAVTLAGLALAAPASIARPLDDGPVARQWPNTAESRASGTESRQWPHTVESRAYSTEAQVLASRGQSAPNPAPRVQTPRVPSTDHGFEWSAAAIGAIVVGALIVLGSLGAAAVRRTRPRTAH